MPDAFRRKRPCQLWRPAAPNAGRAVRATLPAMSRRWGRRCTSPPPWEMTTAAGNWKKNFPQPASSVGCTGSTAPARSTSCGYWPATSNSSAWTRRKRTPVCTAAIASTVAQLAGDVDAIVLSDYAKGSLADVEALISSAQDHGTAVLVDPKGEDFSRYAGATVLKPNEAEFAAVAGHWSDENDFLSRGTSMVQDLQLGALLVTRGERGMTPLPTARTTLDATGRGPGGIRCHRRGRHRHRAHGGRDRLRNGSRSCRYPG